MKSFLHLLMAGGCFVMVGFANAMPPVLLTQDKTIAADLRGTPLLEKLLMRDCQLRLEGKLGQYRLVYSTGSIAVPTNAVKTIQEGIWADVATKGKVGNFSVRMLSVPHFSQPLSEDEIYGTDDHISKFSQPYAGYLIVFSGSEPVVEPKLRQLWSEGVILNYQNHPNPRPGVLQYLADKRILYVQDDIRPMQSPKKITTVDYNCILERTSSN